MKTKHSFYFFCLISMIILGQMSCEKKVEIPNPKSDSYIYVTPVLSWDVSVINEKIAIYSGDTLTYNINIIPKSLVSEVNIYRVNVASGIKELLPGFPITKFPGTGAASFNITFQDSVNSIRSLFPFSYLIEVKETNGAPVTSMTFGQFNSISKIFDSLSTIKTYRNLEIYEYHDLSNNTQSLNPGQKSCIMYNVLTRGAQLSGDTNEWKNYSILLPYVQQDSTSGISTVSYQDLVDTNFSKQTSYPYKTMFKVIDLPLTSFDTVLTHQHIKSLFDTSKDSSRTFKKDFSAGLIVAQIYSNKQDSVAVYPGIFTYALIRINSNIPNGKLNADLKIYNPFTF